MTTATTRKTDMELSDALDTLASGLDRLAGALTDLGPDQRAQVLDRLHRLAGDLGSLVDQVERAAYRGEPSLSH